MRIKILFPAAALLVSVLAAAPGTAVSPPPAGVGSDAARAAVPAVTVEPVVGGLSMPTDIASPPGSSDLYIAQQCGAIRVFTGGALRRVGSLASRVACDGERGLLSIAFHPRFARNHRMFVYFSREGTGDIQIARVKVEKRRLVPDSYHPVLRIPHRQASNHNGGKLVFGERDLLYISTGDGGGGGNEFGHAQDHRSLLGKILRIDVTPGPTYTSPRDNPLVGRGGRPEIWAIGLRNPWRMALDRATDQLWVADVGQGEVEEIDRVPSGAGRLRNFGWSRYEGDQVFDAGVRLRGGRLIKPVLTYRHPRGESVIGGAVYRGTESPGLQGYYVYGDLNGWIAGFDVTAPASDFEINPGSGLLTISEAAGGELYAGYADGTVYHILTPSG